MFDRQRVASFVVTGAFSLCDLGTHHINAAIQLYQTQGIQTIIGGGQRFIERFRLFARVRVAVRAACAANPWLYQSTRAAESGCPPRAQTGASPRQPQLYQPGCEGYDPELPDRLQIVCGAVPRLAAAGTL